MPARTAPEAPLRRERPTGEPDRTEDTDGSGAEDAGGVAEHARDTAEHACDSLEHACDSVEHVCASVDDAPVAGATEAADAAPDTAPDTAVDNAPDATEPPEAPAPRTREGRGADARALTQVLFKKFATLEPGTPEHARVRAALIEANLPLVRYAAARFRSRNEPMEDVVQVGTIGLINAIDRFDPDRGVQFPTFAMPTVIGEIKRYFRDNVRTVHVPRRLHELWVQVNGATEDLTVLHGRSPTTAEIAERLKIPEEEVLACIEAGRSYHATSLEAAQEGDGLPGLLDRLGYEDPALAGVEHRDLVRHLLVQLPEREQRILLLRYYSNLTQSQISAELGVSQMHVSRLLSRSFARLRSANRIDA
ncbi:hypothetical protein GCM10010218_24180 [Streptomyces mashuensis]|uniref:RNA polymerase sigma-70 domain-containing protein n=1 Tax=Streptomyces mashuensis TaxID=33904 RepID=A0A919B2W2_9ACTN|nr:hypothetical protein GCM10010218_24180 [Streptomyces mashuensis]